MSRSYKKYPHITSTIGYFKRYSNKKNRQRKRELLHDYEIGDVPLAESLEIDSGGDFKKNGLTYTIRDFIYIIFDNSGDSAEMSRMIRK